MPTKRHHYLPQCYLENFLPTDKPKTFWVYDKVGGAPRQQTPINTGVEGHLYTVIGPEGDPDDFVEVGILAPADGRVAPILRRWVEPGAQPTKDELSVMVEFLAYMHSRVPRRINHMQEFGKLYAVRRSQELACRPDLLNKYLERYEREHPDSPAPSHEDLQTSFTNVEERFELSINRQAAMLISLACSRSIAEELASMHWELIHLQTDDQFVTCDAPLVSFASDDSGRAVFGAGYGISQAEVSFPVSPSSCLFLNRWAPGNSVVPNKAFVREMNKRTARIAERFVISQKPSSEAEELTKRFAYTTNLPKLDREQLFRMIDKITDSLDD
jgi:hypothetical protein